MLRESKEFKISIPYNNRLWEKKNVFCGADCDENYDEHGAPYRQINFAKLGCSLSEMVIVESNLLECRGYEPNCAKIKSFCGKLDFENDQVLFVFFVFEATRVIDIYFFVVFVFVTQ